MSINNRMFMLVLLMFITIGGFTFLVYRQYGRHVNDDGDRKSEQSTIDDTVMLEETSENDDGLKEEKNPGDYTPGVVTYEVKFIALWSADTHPSYYNSIAHFTPFLIYSHDGKRDSYVFEEGNMASEEFEYFAETGVLTHLMRSLDNLLDEGHVFKYSEGERIDSPGATTEILEFTKEHSNLTFLSVVGPSPDWFVAANTNLLDNGEWVSSKRLDVITYDAGTDSGKILTADDIDTSPKEYIKKFDNYLQGLGYLEIKKI